jgi:16S rRNA C967 or C1407 C5-methylase (RsmB/RsmF family)/NOL1/NOP2/fmu family ribosome biogenesis protein
MSERSLNPDFVAMLAQHPQLNGLADALANTAPDVSVRINTLKGCTLPADADRVPWCETGYYLPERPQFTFDPALHQGLYYVQDASSMILHTIAKRLTANGEAVRWLDACAAPGGKTTAIVDAVPQDSLVVANEFDYKRAAALLENVERWGAANVVVSRGDTNKFRKLGGFFDIVSVDAPCSGEGMMRKEAVAVQQWSPRLVQQCADLQREIVENVWQALRPGGVLVYSTCTFNLTEDEQNVQWIIDELGAEPIELQLSDLPGVIGGIDTEVPCARFLPGRVRGEGLFVAVLRKNGDAPAARVSLPKGVKTVKSPGNWLQGDYAYIADGDKLRAIPAPLLPAVLRLSSVLSVVSSGLHIATVKGKDYVPAYALAHAVDLNLAAWHTLPVSLDTALTYLRGEALTPAAFAGTAPALPSIADAPRGIVLLTYNDRPLGFVKNLGNRANNLLPDNRRILSRR